MPSSGGRIIKFLFLFPFYPIIAADLGKERNKMMNIKKMEKKGNLTVTFEDGKIIKASIQYLCFGLKNNIPKDFGIKEIKVGKITPKIFSNSIQLFCSECGMRKVDKSSKHFLCPICFKQIEEIKEYISNY